MNEEPSIFGPAWGDILAEIIRDLAGEPSPSDEVEQ